VLEESVMLVRQPDARDGFAVHRLISRCEPLDPNSLYCNLLQCSHFTDTCAIAFGDAEAPVGFVSAYIPPGRGDTLFVWQVAVAPEARRQGLARRMIREILFRPICRQVAFLEASITKSNRSSWRLFLSLAEEFGSSHRTEPLFEANRHFENTHETETLLRIGPLDKTVPSSKSAE